MSAVTAEVVRPGESTALTRVDASEKIMSLCSNGEQSLKFITDMGKTLADSRMLKLKNPQQGAAVILASICEGTTPFQIMREFHIMDDGGMSMKSDVMLAKFNAAGGKHSWVKTGDDGEEAVLRLIWAGQDIQVSYSIEDARRAGLVRAKSNWEKDPGSMLRARATSKGVRMVMPGIVAGIYCPEDFDTVELPPAEPPKTRQTKTAGTTSAAKSPPADDVIDAQVESASTETAAEKKEEPPFEGGAAAGSTTAPANTTLENDITAVLMEIELTLGEVGMTKADLEASLQKKTPPVTIDTLKLDQAKAILEKLRAKKQASQAA